MMELSLQDFSKASADMASSLATAWGAAADRYVSRVITEGGEALLTARRKTELFTECMSAELATLSWNANRWASAAADAGNNGIAAIQMKYADIFAAKAAALADSSIAADARLTLFASEIEANARVAERLFGSSLGVAIPNPHDLAFCHGAVL